jgi:hypothetical protein
MEKVWPRDVASEALLVRRSAGTRRSVRQPDILIARDRTIIPSFFFGKFPVFVSLKSIEPLQDGACGIQESKLGAGKRKLLPHGGGPEDSEPEHISAIVVEKGMDVLLLEMKQLLMRQDGNQLLNLSLLQSALVKAGLLAGERLQVVGSIALHKNAGEPPVRHPFQTQQVRGRSLRARHFLGSEENSTAEQEK